MFESHVQTCIDRISFDFGFEDFLGNMPLKIIIYCVTEQPAITWLQRSFLFLVQVIIFQGWWAAQWALCQNCAKWKYFNPNLCPLLTLVKVCCQEFLYILSGWIKIIQLEQSYDLYKITLLLSSLYDSLPVHIATFKRFFSCRIVMIYANSWLSG